jgi:hypothetical protein
MSGVFSETGISVLDFIQISALFLLTMLLFFGIRNKKHFWLHTLSLLILSLQCTLLILFKGGLTTKIFAALMLMTTLIVETVISRRKNLEASKQEM